MATPAGRLPAGWELHRDDAGEVYYWNRDTDESTWERPQHKIGGLMAQQISLQQQQQEEEEQQRRQAAKAAAAPLIKSFLDPNMAAGFSRTMRHAETRTEEEQAAADMVADFIRSEGGPQDSVEEAAVAAAATDPSPAGVLDMTSLESPEDDLYAEPQPQPQPEPSAAPAAPAATALGVGTAPLGAGDDVGEVDRTLTYKEIVAMKKAGKRPPGIRDIDDKPRGPPAAGFARAPNMPKVLKPWERAADAAATSASSTSTPPPPPPPSSPSSSVRASVRACVRVHMGAWEREWACGCTVARVPAVGLILTPQPQARVLA
jgi:hypothetical protein